MAQDPITGLIELIANAQTQIENARYLTSTSIISGYVSLLTFFSFPAVVSFTILIYDIIICMDDEITFIWSRRWSFARAVHHANRLAPFIVLA
jgi:hypothetical protein